MPESTMRVEVLFALLLSLVPASRVAAQDAYDVEIDPRSRSPLAQPDRSWQQALAALPVGHEVRRLAFAEHILFVAHSPPDGSAITLTGFVYEDGQLQSDGGEAAEHMQCRAPGVDVARIAPALQALLATPAWQHNAGRIDALILECITDPRLYWILLLEPEGGPVAGQPLPTVELPFDTRIR